MGGCDKRMILKDELSKDAPILRRIVAMPPRLNSLRA